MSTPSVRPARFQDATHLAALVDIAGEGLATYFWGQMAGIGQSPFEIGRIRAQRDEGAFTWRNAHVAEVDGEVAGALIGYRIADDAADEDLSEMSEIVRPLAELEALAPGHWYVNVLAVFPEFRGRGIGTVLLARADEIGRRDAPAGMAIIVAGDNEGAVRLYQKVGYRIVARRPVFPFPGNRRGGDWLLLTKAHP
ncbi:MAG: GNAT family N-acetyltransferase [Bauldia sp.]|nr:GNAT family N-acetyltransferase [Bauldia sp.]